MEYSFDSDTQIIQDDSIKEMSDSEVQAILDIDT